MNMPGIMGILAKHVVGDEEARLQKMMDSMRYEPFFSHGTFSDKTRGIFIGYTTLGGSFSDCMPVWNETKDKVLFMTGEVFLERDLITALRKKGHQFNPDDASCLIHLFEEDDKAFFGALNGSFNGIIVDLAGDRAILFNDRYGVRRLYYSETDSGLAFSAEAKALLRAYPSLRQLSDKGISEYLVYDCVLEDRTYFKDIGLVPSGSAWFYAHGNIAKTRYHDSTSLERQPQLTPEAFTDSFIDTFHKVLPRYFRGKTVGLGLTGGLDTRCIISSMNPAPGQLPCYTFKFKTRNMYDVRIAPLVAQQCQQPHSFLEIDEKQFWKSYPETVGRMIYASDGMGSVEQADLLLFNNMSRQISQVRMTGKYGTEVLKNGRGLKQETAPRMELIHPDFRPHLAEARTTRAGLRPFTDFSFYLHMDLPWWWNKYIAIESTQVDIRSPYLDNDIVKLVYQAPPMSTPARERIQLALIGHFNPALLRIPSTSFHREGESAIRRKLKRLLLVGEKIYSREEVPHGFTHKVAKIDRVIKPLHIERWLTGWVFRNNRVLFRDQLSPYLVDTLLGPRTYGRSFWDKVALERMLRDHIAGRGNYLREIRKVLQIELMSQAFID
jgi:asparagine synthase (glutamine-hydrolysing)